MQRVTIISREHDCSVLEMCTAAVMMCTRMRRKTFSYNAKIELCLHTERDYYGAPPGLSTRVERADARTCEAIVHQTAAEKAPAIGAGT